MILQESSVLLERARSYSQIGIYTIASGMVSCFGTMSMGMALAYSSPAISDLSVHGILDDDQASWFGSLVNIGAIIGGFIGGFTVEIAGRKGCLILTGLPFSLGWLCILCGPALSCMYIGRLLTGIGAGMASLAVCIYIAEISPREVRGTLGSGFQVSATLGMLCVYGMGVGLGWQWIAVICSVPPTLLTSCMVFMPESPRWLLAKHLENDALMNLALLRGMTSEDSKVKQELAEMEITMYAKNRPGLGDLFSTPKYYRPFILTMVIMFLQQAVGINGMVFYVQPLLERSGFYHTGAIVSLAFGLLQLGAVLFSSMLADQVGRRPLLIVSSSVLSGSCFMFGIYYIIVFAHPSTVSTLNWLALVSLILYIAAYSLGWGALTRVITSEIVPYRIRGFTTGVGTALNWSMSFLVTKSFNSLFKDMHGFGLFWIFATVAFWGVVFVHKFVPETRGCSLEDIERYFDNQADLQHTELRQRHKVITKDNADCNKHDTDTTQANGRSHISGCSHISHDETSANTEVIPNGYSNYG